VKTKLKSAGHPAGAPPPGLSLGRAWRGLLAFYLVALALNAVSLHRNNEQAAPLVLGGRQRPRGTDRRRDGPGPAQGISDTDNRGLSEQIIGR